MMLLGFRLSCHNAKTEAFINILADPSTHVEYLLSLSWLTNCSVLHLYLLGRNFSVKIKVNLPESPEMYIIKPLAQKLVLSQL